MVRRFKILSLLCCSLLFFNFAEGQDVQIQFKNALESGNVKTFAKLFDHRIEINLDGETHFYSQQQAQVVLNKFLSSLKNAKYNLVHSGASKAQSKYFIGKLTTDTVVYSVYLFLKKINGNEYVQEIKFEKVET